MVRAGQGIRGRLSLGNARNIAFWVVLFLLILALFNLFSGGQSTMSSRSISYSDFVSAVDRGEVATVTLDGERVMFRGSDGQDYVTIRPEGADITDRLIAAGRDRQRAAAGAVGLHDRADDLPAVPAADRRLDLLHEPDAGRRTRRRDGLRQVPRQAPDREARPRDLRRRGRHRRGQGGARGDRRVPAQPAEVLAPRRQDPEGRAARRPARHGQDAPRARHRGRGGRAVLHHLGLGLRRDVRGRGREPRARHVRAGQEERALHRLHRRDRRRRPVAVAWATAAATTNASRR
jgi:hypothetical protein